MQCLEVSAVVRLIYMSLGVKGLSMGRAVLPAWHVNGQPLLLNLVLSLDVSPTL